MNLQKFLTRPPQGFRHGTELFSSALLRLRFIFRLCRTVYALSYYAVQPNHTV